VENRETVSTWNKVFAATETRRNEANRVGSRSIVSPICLRAPAGSCKSPYCAPAPIDPLPKFSVSKPDPLPLIHHKSLVRVPGKAQVLPLPLQLQHLLRSLVLRPLRCWSICSACKCSSRLLQVQHLKKNSLLSLLETQQRCRGLFVLPRAGFRTLGKEHLCRGPVLGKE